MSSSAGGTYGAVSSRADADTQADSYSATPREDDCEQQQHQLEQNTGKVLLTPNSGTVAVRRKKPSTPERIRRQTDKLYDEVHELMERQQTRTERQKEMARRASTASQTASNAAATGSHSGRGRNGVRETDDQPELPDLWLEFEQSRKRHLQDAQSARTLFPPVLQEHQETAAYSTKDPSAFSRRFDRLPTDAQ